MWGSDFPTLVTPKDGRLFSFLIPWFIFPSPPFLKSGSFPHKFPLVILVPFPSPPHRVRTPFFTSAFFYSRLPGSTPLEVENPPPLFSAHRTPAPKSFLSPLETSFMFRCPRLFHQPRIFRTLISSPPYSFLVCPPVERSKTF